MPRHAGALERGPLVTRCRSRTVTKVTQIGFVVRRWIQCSLVGDLNGGKSLWFTQGPAGIDLCQG